MAFLPVTFNSAPSTLFLEKTMNLLRERDFIVLNCDVTIQAERPRLKPFKPRMAALLGEILKCVVNVKAGTNEGCGEIGRGEAVAAHAVVLLAADESLESDRTS